MPRAWCAICPTPPNALECSHAIAHVCQHQIKEMDIRFDELKECDTVVGGAACCVLLCARAENFWKTNMCLDEQTALACNGDACSS